MRGYTKMWQDVYHQIEDSCQIQYHQIPAEVVRKIHPAGPNSSYGVSDFGCRDALTQLTEEKLLGASPMELNIHHTNSHPIEFIPTACVSLLDMQATSDIPDSHPSSGVLIPI